MEEFLKKFHISEVGIKIYTQIVNYPLISYREIQNQFFNLNEEDLTIIIEELVKNELLIPTSTSDTENSREYRPIAPVKLINKYFNNVSSNESSINSQIIEYLSKTLKKNVQKYGTQEIEALHSPYSKISDDFAELSLVQKQDVDDTIERMEEVNKKLKQNYEISLNSLKKRILTNFGHILIPFDVLEPKVKKLLENVDPKKDSENLLKQLKNISENQAKEHIIKKTQELTNIIEEEFNKIALNELVNQNIQYRTDLKLLILNLMNEFELKLNTVSNLLKRYDDSTIKKTKKFEQELKESIESTIKKSVKDIISLTEPVEKTLEDFLNRISIGKEMSEIKTEISKMIDFEVKPSLADSKAGQESSIKFSQPIPTVKKLEPVQIQQKIPKTVPSQVKEHSEAIHEESQERHVSETIDTQKSSETIKDGSVQKKQTPVLERDYKALTIEEAFKLLGQNLLSLKGKEFSQDLQKIADKILETKGFSTTLHAVGKIINQFKNSGKLLTEADQKLILKNFEEWKQKLKD